MGKGRQDARFFLSLGQNPYRISVQTIFGLVSKQYAGPVFLTSLNTTTPQFKLAPLKAEVNGKQSIGFLAYTPIPLSLCVAVERLIKVPSTVWRSKTKPLAVTSWFLRSDNDSNAIIALFHPLLGYLSIYLVLKKRHKTLDMTLQGAFKSWATSISVWPSLILPNILHFLDVFEP